MAFDPSGIEITLYKIPERAAIGVVWDSTWPDGSIYQIYLDSTLYQETTEKRVEVPWPTEAGILIQVGRIDPSESGRDLAPDVPSGAGSGGRPFLEWLGGRYLAPDGDSIKAWRIYRSSEPGGAVDYSKPVAELGLWPSGHPRDGAGVGGAGQGGAGRSRVEFSWRDRFLPAGDWTYDIRAVANDGSESSQVTGIATVTGPPRAPAPNSAGDRLTYSYDSGTNLATLEWLPSPDDSINSGTEPEYPYS